MHNVLNVTCEDRVLHNIKHYLNVLSVRCRGEMAIELLGLVLPDSVEHAHHKRLDVLQFVGVSTEIGEVVSDTSILDLVFQKIRLVEEENNGDCAEATVVDYRVKDVDALHQAVGDAILKQGLVERA